MIIEDARFETVYALDVEYNGSKEFVIMVCLKLDIYDQWISMINRGNVCYYFMSNPNLIDMCVEDFNKEREDIGYKPHNYNDYILYDFEDYDLTTNDIVFKAIKEDKDEIAKVLKLIWYMAIFDNDKEGQKIVKDIIGKEISKLDIIKNIDLKELEHYYLIS